MGEGSIRRHLLVDVLPNRGSLAFRSGHAVTLDRVASRLTVAAEAEPAFKILQFEAIHVRALADSFYGTGPAPVRELGHVADAFDQASFGWRSARARLSEGRVLKNVDERRAAAARAPISEVNIRGASHDEKVAAFDSLFDYAGSWALGGRCG